jgi:hypothetical protein
MQKHSLEALARELSAKAAAAKGGRAAETVLGGHEKVLRQSRAASPGKAGTATCSSFPTRHTACGRCRTRSSC